ncbi:Phosphate/sulfate permease [Archaeoglobus sulfaticallidus PM70-1]|uniref:Phosphate/sulfate permease n=2 Tax=Archaeoglobus TaxID=2233 RepID=N0BKM0_9EURY|nr:Phosphate/sulfate permease [Archaeoglobus sulfaticallidus PM70-1]
MRTVGSELVDLNIHIISISLIISSIAIILSNWKKLPVSSHQAIVSSLVGSGLAFGVSVDFNTLIRIVESWVISPVSAFFASVIVYRIMESVVSKMPPLKVERAVRYLLLLSGSLIAYNTGANELATALGPIVCYGLLTPLQAGIAGTALLWLGAYLLGSRVVETVGKGITSLDPFSGFSAQMGAGISVLLFTSLGMPISTTYCIIGGVTGVGILKSTKTIRSPFLKKIFLSWVITPLTAMILGYSISSLLA